jgi:glycosyltransferase involved in cell wall biosynthesis/tetratricopeptide (TPR) repeat protein
MATESPLRSISRVAPLPEDELAELERLLCSAQGFTLVFVRSSTPVDTRRILEPLTANLATKKIRLRELPLAEEVLDLYDRLLGMHPKESEVLVVTGFEHSISFGVGAPSALERLNRARARFRKLSCPVVLVLPKRALDQLARWAPDFWAWSRAVIQTRTVSLPPVTPAAELPGDVGLLNLTSQQKNRHFEVLYNKLADQERDNTGNEAGRSELNRQMAWLLLSLGELKVADIYAQKAWKLSPVGSRERELALNELAVISEARGDLDGALRIRREEELPLYKKTSNVRGQAITRGRIADILEIRGKHDEALNVHQELLSVYEELQDVRERAVTMGRIADLHQARGKLDEALRLRQEVLPVYEELKDRHAQAVTWGRIADVLEEQGKLDEALRIREEEVFPVYEQLGSLREQAMILVKIADVLKSRGDYNEALRIYRDESLPVFERLDRPHDLVHVRTKIAQAYLGREESSDRERAVELLDLALRDAERLHIPEADWIHSILEEHGLEANASAPHVAKPPRPPYLQDEESEQRVAEQAIAPEPPTEHTRTTPLAFLVFATEWDSKHGGLSTFNRELCRALARRKLRVLCKVAKTNDAEIKSACADSVEIIRVIPRDFSPDVIVGHDLVTGYEASSHKSDEYKESLLVQFIHTAPNLIEAYKTPPAGVERADKADDKSGRQLDLTADADLVVGVGPLLLREISTLLFGRQSKSEVYQLNPGIAEEEASDGMPLGVLCLVLARAEDDILKGLDIAACAVRNVGKHGKDPAPILHVRGAEPGGGDNLNAKLLNVSRLPQNRLRVRPYTANADRIGADIRSSSVVLMPSRSEGFGLVGLEALALGVPILVSSESGLGELLRGVADDVAHLFVVNITGNDEKDVRTWEQAIDRVLSDRLSSFAQALKLRDRLRETLSWDVVAEELIQRIARELLNRPVVG